jgi:hypothetical protein
LSETDCAALAGRFGGVLDGELAQHASRRSTQATFVSERILTPGFAEPGRTRTPEPNDTASIVVTDSYE